MLVDLVFSTKAGVLGERLSTRYRLMLVGWFFVLFALPFPYVNAITVAGNSLSLSLVMSLMGTWSVIFGILIGIDIIRLKIVILFVLFASVISLNMFFWISWSIVPLVEILKNLVISFTYIIMLLLIKGTKTVSQILARILVRLYFVFLSFNYIVAIAQTIARLAGLSLTFPWQPGATGIGFYSSRLCGLMGEPEHLGLISVGLIFTKKDDRKEFLLSLFSIIVLIISFSATSWVIALLIFFSLIQKLKRRSVLLIILIMLFVLLFARNMPGYARIISAASLADNSSFVRVAKGIAVYIDLDLPMKLLGTGPGDTSVYKSLYSGSLYGRIQAGDNFINGLFGELLSFGMIASIILNYIYFVIIGGRKEWTYFMAFTILRLGTSINCSNPFLPLILLPMLSEIQRAKTCDN